MPQLLQAQAAGAPWLDGLLGVSAFFLSTLPLTQFVAAALLLPPKAARSWRAVARLPLNGGARTLVLQALSWVRLARLVFLFVGC